MSVIKEIRLSEHHSSHEFAAAAQAEMPGERDEVQLQATDAAVVSSALAVYRAVFANSSDAVAIIDVNGHYVEQNAAHEQLIGYSNAELEGLTPAIHLGEAEFARIAAELRSGGSSRGEVVSRTRKGEYATIELSAFAVTGSGGEPMFFVGIKRDVTERNRAAAGLRQKVNELQALYRMAETVARAGELEEIYSAALDELQHTVGADRAAVLLFDDDGVMRFKDWRGLSEGYRRAAEGHSPWPADATDPQPVLVPDVYNDPHLESLFPVFEKEGVRALGFIPLVDSSKLLGKFMVYYNEPHELDDASLQLTQTIASHIAFAIARKRSETALRVSEERYRLLADAGSLLNSSLDYEETLRSITRLAVPSVADWCLVDLLDDDGGFQRIAAASRADEESDSVAALLIRHYAPAPDALHGVSYVARTGVPELVAAVDEDLLRSFARDETHLKAMRGMHATSYICVPLLTRGRTIGALTFAVGKESGRRYSAADLPLAQELGRRVAMAVENASLYRDAQEANRAKSQFLATMSHELRTPLNAIGGYSELMQLGLRGPLTDEQRQDLSRIQRSQKHLLGLINDILSFARIETGHVELNLRAVPVEELLQELPALLEPQINMRQIHFEHTVGDPGVTCVADPDKLRQVLLNLLSNAVKFTQPGGSVSVQSEALRDTVRIHVRDTGPGIAPAMLERIFEPFVQLADSLTRVADGTGLGLAISRELARAMGGDVTVRSVEGEGSVFTCELPVMTHSV